MVKIGALRMLPGIVQNNTRISIYCNPCATSDCVPVAGSSGSRDLRLSHSSLSLLRVGLLQHAPHGATLEEHSEATGSVE